MGQCGCGDFAAQHKIPGPDGTVYSVQVYDSCSECQTPAGVILTKHDAESREMWDVDHLPDLREDGYGGYTIPVLHPKDLVKTMLAWAGPGIEEDYAADGLIQDAVSECFRDAVWETYRGHFLTGGTGQ